MAIVYEDPPKKYIYKTEKDMVEPFCLAALSPKYCLAFQEVQYFTNRSMEFTFGTGDRRTVDIVVMDPGHNKLISYELKLRDYKKVLQQAIHNLEFFSNYSALVMPEPVLKKNFYKIKCECKYLNIGAYGLTNTGSLIPFNRINYRKMKGKPFSDDEFPWYIQKMPIFQCFNYRVTRYDRVSLPRIR